MDNQTFLACRNFLIERFTKYPQYSFGDATIMIDHSINVQKIALNLAEDISCNKEVIFFGSIFHDIGKTKTENGVLVSWEVLREKHEAFSYEVISELLNKLNVSETSNRLLKSLFETDQEMTERFLIKDADIIEFYMNIRLQNALQEWSSSVNIVGELQRKADKYDKVLHFEKSKEIALPYLKLMKRRWNLK